MSRAPQVIARVLLPLWYDTRHTEHNRPVDVPTTATPRSSSDSNPLDRSLTAFTDSERRAMARQERVAQHDRRQLANLHGTFAGTLTNLAEKGARSVIGLASGGRVIGRIVLVGSDVVVIDGPQHSTIIGRRHIVWAQSQSDSSQREDLPLQRSTTFAEVTDQRFLAGDRLSLAIPGHEAICGRLIAVGQDQITIRRDGDGDIVAVAIAVIEQLGAS